MFLWFKEKVFLFRKNKDGNMAALLSLSVVVVMFVIGVAIDISTAASKKQTMQDNIDAALLAAASRIYYTGAKKRDGQAIINDMLKEHLTRGGLNCQPIKVKKNTINLNCDGDVPTLMPKIVGKKKLSYKINSTVVAETPGNTEISFVYDISNSMRGRKLRSLEKALKNFVSHEVFTASNSSTIFSLIPFANTVAFDLSYDKWLDPVDGLSLTPNFTGCFTRETTDVNRPFTGRDTEISAPLKRPRGKHNACPPQSMAARFFNKDRRPIKSLITNLQPTFGTGTSDAMVWGYRSLHPDMRGIIDDNTSYPRDFHAKNKKVLILMTDGKPFNDFWTDGPRKKGIGNKETQSIRKLVETCDYIKAKNEPIDIYVVALGDFITRSGKDLRTVFKNCTQGDGHFTTTGSRKLSETITSIISQDKVLRISS